MALTEAAAAKQAVAAAWALQQIGSRDYYNLCQRFIENAYGTSGQYRSAAAASGALNWGTDPNQADVGDLVFFRPDPSNGGAGHVGIYLGNGEMVGATNGGITRDNFLTNPYWRNLFAGFGDPPDQWKGKPATQDLIQGAAQLAGNAKSLAGNAAGAVQQFQNVSWGAAAPYANQLLQAAAQHQVPVNVLAGLLIQESGGNPRAVSPAGAQGLMQFMPGTARSMGIDPFDPAQAIDGGARYLKQLADQSGGDWAQAVGKYNAGPAGNLNNAETRNHITKVMGFADQMGGSMVMSPPGLPGGFPGAPPPPGGGGNRERPRDENRQTGTSALAGLWDRLKALGIDIAKAATTPPRTSQSPGAIPPGVPVPPGVSPAAPPPAGGGGPNEPVDTGAPGTGVSPPLTGDADRGFPGNLNYPGGPPAPGTANRPRPQGWTDPNSIQSPANRGLVEIMNGFLQDLDDLDAEIATLDLNTPQGRARRSQIEAAQNNIKSRITALAPQIRQVEQDEAGRREGTVLPGSTPYMPNIPIIKRQPDGTYKIDYVPNPNAPENPSISTANISATSAANVAGIQGETSRDVAGINARSAENVANIQSGTSLGVAGINAESANNVANINSQTQRVTTALAQAVEQRRQDIDAQIRSGDLSLREATERFNQWYKQNVEAPLAILNQQRQTEQYKINQQQAITQRATGQAEHERGTAQIGTQMWNAAAGAYNQMIPLTVGDQWGRGFQQNLQGQGFTPNSGATYNTAESLDQFATRKVAEMLKGISPYAASIAQAQGQLGNPGTPMGGDQMSGLTNQATGVASNALANPYQMPDIPDFQMPGQVNIPQMAGIGQSGLGPAIQQALPPPPGIFGPNAGYGRG